MYEMLMMMMFLTTYYLMKVDTPFFTSLLIVMFVLFSSSMMTMKWLNWMFMSIMIMFLGGMMIVFIYASSLSFNQKNFVSLVSSFEFSAIMLLFSMFLFLEKNFEVKNLSEIFGAYSAFSSMSLIFLAIYLLAVLLIIIKMICCHEGPLKNSF